MGSVITLIVFVAILVSVIGRASKKSVPAKKPGQTGNRQISGNHQMTGNRQMAQQSMQSRPAYGEQPYQKPISKNDIFERAAAHVKQQEKGKAVDSRTDIAAGQMPDKKAAYFEREPENSVLMQKIENLIIKGYDSELTFERDFIGEGVELLNRMQM